MTSEYNHLNERITEETRARLEYLRGEIVNERISWEEVFELTTLADYVDRSDVLLLEWAGVPEFEDENEDATEDEETR